MKYGIMQGRLTPSRGRGIQFFPFDNWEQEFHLGQQIGIDEIEWIFDYDSYENNPLWTDSGLKEIQKAMKDTSVTINSVCFDYFMVRAFYRNDDKDLYEENISIVKHVLDNMSKIGAKIFEIPIVDGSSIQNKEHEDNAIRFIKELYDYSKKYEIKIGLETDFGPGRFRDFLNRLKGIYANYDSGNSSGLGYNHRDELLSLNEMVANVHIKDRIFGGTTVELGTGNADFEAVFSSLKAINYKGSIILQAARGEDGNEISNIKSQLEFVREYVDKYELG